MARRNSLYFDYQAIYHSFMTFDIVSLLINNRIFLTTSTSSNISLKSMTIEIFTVFIFLLFTPSPNLYKDLLSISQGRVFFRLHLKLHYIHSFISELIPSSYMCQPQFLYIVIQLTCLFNYQFDGKCFVKSHS